MTDLPINPNQFLEEARYELNIVKTMLYFSTRDESIELPTIEELVHSEIIHAVVDYETGKESIYQPPRGDYKLEKEMWEYFKREVPQNGRLPLKIHNALTHILEATWERDCIGDGEYDSLFNTIFKGGFGGGICEVITHSTFSLPQILIQKVEKEILPPLPCEEKTVLETIGKNMRKYIDRDLDYIRKTYHW